MTPEARPWERPLCQTRTSLHSAARERALRRFGPCNVCGRPTDGLHSQRGAPLVCEGCCTLPHKEERTSSGDSEGMNGTDRA